MIIDILYCTTIGQGVRKHAKTFGAEVQKILSEFNRNYSQQVKFRFKRVAKPDRKVLIIQLTLPKEIRVACAGIENEHNLSCAHVGRDITYINSERWQKGSNFHDVPIPAYRKYVILHEVFHLLGMPHYECPGPGAKAPVMLQQTYRLDGCKFNNKPTEPELAELREHTSWRF